MDLMTLMGLVAGIATVWYVMADGNVLHLLFNKVALVLVFGGTFSSTLIAYPWEIIKLVPGSIKLMFVRKRYTEEDRQAVISNLSALAEKARRQNIDGLQIDALASKDRFLSYGLQMVVDGLEHEVVRENLEKRIVMAHKQSQKVTGLFRTMATLSPIFGLLGTLIGVVQVLRNLSDPASMGASMAIAITTTFYGIFAANFFFLPAAIKLGEYTENEIMHMRLIAEGVISIRAGDLPIILRKKLNAFLMESSKTSGSITASAARPSGSSV